VPRYTGDPGVGDVIVTREGHPLVSWLIRLGGRLRGGRGMVNHAIVVHHRDPAGRLWGIEGRPGGVGWREITPKLLEHPATNANTGQPKTDEQRLLVAAAAHRLLGAAYDWRAISDAARQAARLWRVFKGEDWPDGQTPVQVMCSALADWAYEEVRLPSPRGTDGTRWTTPEDWDLFTTREGWTDV
jgi:hypothetical protein